MWKPVWNPMWSECENMCERDDVASHPFHIYFTMQNFTCTWNMCVKCMWKVCEKRVKNVWKECENRTFFTRFSHGVSHTYFSFACKLAANSALTASSTVAGQGSLSFTLTSCGTRYQLFFNFFPSQYALCSFSPLFPGSKRSKN